MHFRPGLGWVVHAIFANMFLSFSAWRELVDFSWYPSTVKLSRKIISAMFADLAPSVFYLGPLPSALLSIL